MTPFKLDIFTPAGLLLSAAVQSVKLPATNGEVQVLPGHATYVGVLGTGIVEYQLAEGGAKSLVISGGFVSFLDGILAVLTDLAITSDNIARDYDAERDSLKQQIKLGYYDDPESCRARERLAVINSVDRLLSN